MLGHQRTTQAIPAQSKSQLQKPQNNRTMSAFKSVNLQTRPIDSIRKMFRFHCGQPGPGRGGEVKIVPACNTRIGLVVVCFCVSQPARRALPARSGSLRGFRDNPACLRRELIFTSYLLQRGLRHLARPTLPVCTQRGPGWNDTKGQKRTKSSQT